jgi:hypothetical protein
MAVSPSIASPTNATNHPKTVSPIPSMEVIIEEFAKSSIEFGMFGPQDLAGLCS